MNTSGPRLSPTGRALASLLAALPVALFMACDSSSRITGLRPSDPMMAESASPTSPATGVVISQVYGGGGNAGSTYKNDFIELYNAGTTPVNLGGWSVQYTSSAGTTWTNRTNLTGVVAPGHYYLIREAAQGGGTTPIPAPDDSGAILMAAGAGKVALVKSTAALTGACPKADVNVVDFVGYGSGTNCFEGTVGPTATISASLAALRAFNGQQDANDNAADFATGPANPRNSTMSTEPPVAVLTAAVTPLTPTLDPGATLAFTASAAKASQIVAVTSAAWTSSDAAVATIDPATGAALAVGAGTTTIGVTVTTDAGTATASTVLTVTGVITPSAVIISQVYGGGGNNGSTLKNDFIELYNGGTTDVNLTGWSIQYSSASGGTWSLANKTDLSGTIPAGHYFLIKESAGTGGTVDLPTADVTGTITVGGTSGKIALVRNTSVLSGACPKADAAVADFVGYGLADCFRGAAPTGVLSAATAAVRRDYGRANTNDNGDDFDVLDPTPRTRAQTPPPVGDAATIAVSPGFWSMRLGQTRLFSTAARGTDGSLVSTPIVWSTSDAAVATVDPARGLVTAKGLGTAAITATSPNGVAGTATVNVIIGNVTVQARPDPLPKGFQTQLFLNNGSTDSNNNPVVNSDITWSTSNAAIVSVNPTTGVITATGLGSAVITALSRTDNQSTGSTTIVVNEPLVAGGARIGHNTELGIPTDADPSDDKLIVRRQYTTSYNPTRGVTNWVSWNLDATHKGGLARCNCMTADTALVRLGFPAYDTNDWVNNGLNGQYSRGHMSPSADWNVSNGDNAATFFLTNMLPQNQDQNGGPWGAFEDYLRTRATGSTEIYIVSGGIFTRGRRGAGIDGFGTISNAGKIAIPDSVWKIAVIVPDARDASGIVNPADVEVIVINTPNEKPAAGAVWNDYATTIDKIQQSTGYDFLSALPQKVQCRLEARNCGPSAVITGGGVAGGSEGQTLDFTASASTDPEGDALSYRWEINGQPAGSGATLSHLFGNDGAYQVRLIVADAGSADTTTTSVSIANVSPAVNAFSGGSIAEGATFATSGSFADPGMDQWAATVDYGDGSGVQPLALVGNSFSLGHRYADNGTYTVTVTVSELGVASATGSNVATVTVANVPPQVAAFLGATILRGETYGAAGTFGDPGADTWTARVVYGDGSAAAPLAVSGMGFQLGHLYSTAGDFTVLVTITDKDGGAGTGSARVVVQTTTQGMATLGDMVVALAASSGSINGSQLASLRALVTAGLSHFQRQNPKAAVAQLNAFVNVLNALVKSGKVTGAQAAPLVEYAGRLIASAGV